MKADLDAANRKIVELSSQLNDMKGEKDEQYTHFDHQLRNIRSQAEEWEEKYNSAIKQNEHLKKRIHDLKGLGIPTTTRSKCSIPASSGNDVYEVDSILNHKKEKGHMYFLIHWSGYDSTQDSWEPQSNLKCTALLNRYKKANNLN